MGGSLPAALPFVQEANAALALLFAMLLLLPLRPLLLPLLLVLLHLWLQQLLLPLLLLTLRLLLRAGLTGCRSTGIMCLAKRGRSWGCCSCCWCF